ncbi:MAG TPA: DoxX family protein [Polyangiaceae bacterium]|nr:DoxX family protein [Polyangiaceae bacterium]
MLNRFLAPHAERAYVLLRVVAGLLMALHGAAKFGLLGPAPFPLVTFTQLWFGAWIELVGGLLVAVGLFTVPAAFLLSGTMAVAYIQFHWKFQTGLALFPSKNQGEPALVFCLLFLYFACHGSSAPSVDAVLARRRSSSEHPHAAQEAAH